MLDRRTLIGSATALPFAWVSKAQARTPYTGPMPYEPGPRNFASMEDFRTWDAANREFELRISQPIMQLVMSLNARMPALPLFWTALDNVLAKTTAHVKIVDSWSKQWPDTKMFWLTIDFEGEPSRWLHTYLGKDNHHDSPCPFFGVSSYA